MSDFVLIHGDIANFQPNFTPATVVVRPGLLSGSGPATLNSRPLCVDGDEKKVAVPGCPYTTVLHTIPGTGTLKISALAPNQKALKTYSGDLLVLLKGANFTAELQVETPAQQPPPGPGSPIPDTTLKYLGQGSFSTHNSKFQGT